MVELTGLFVRIPRDQAQALDERCARLGMTKQAVVRQLLDGSLEAGRAVEEADGVLTLAEASVLLRAEIADVRERAEAGDLPGRLLGGDWRFSRRAVLEWLASGEPGDRRRAGFAAERSRR